MGESDREISNIINKYINDFRVDPYFANINTLFILNKLNPLSKDETNYEDKLSEIFGYKKELINFIKINYKFYDDIIEVTNFTFSNYLKKIMIDINVIKINIQILLISLMLFIK